VPADATHHQIGHALLNQWTVQLDAPPVACDGGLWMVGPDGLWRRKSQAQIEVIIGRTFNAHKNAKKVADYRAIAQHIAALADAPDFFGHAPAGVVTPSGFHRLVDGRRQSVRLRPEHRQRHALTVDPDFDIEPHLFFGLLAHAFDNGQDSDQALMAAEYLGSALVGDVHRHQVALLLLGVAGSGKSVLQRLMTEIFPPDSRVAVSPVHWSNEYYVIALAGARLNAVGELPDATPLPAAAFKSVIGGDMVSGRHPTHRPQYFRARCGHIFNSNYPPATLDPGDGFFRRWRVLHFKNPVPPELRDPDLTERILQRELGAVIAWALLGAERVAQAGRIRTTPEHDAVMQRWRIGSNRVLMFLSDPDFCRLGSGEQAGVSELFAAYRQWSQANGYRAMSHRAYDTLLTETAGSLGVVKVRADDRKVKGVSVIASAGGGLL
jgi:putative DNA primase/helicase